MSTAIDEILSGLVLMYADNLETDEYDHDSSRTKVDADRANIATSFRAGLSNRHAILLDLDHGVEHRGIFDGGLRPFHAIDAGLRPFHAIDLGRQWDPSQRGGVAARRLAATRLSRVLEDLELGCLSSTMQGANLYLWAHTRYAIVPSSTEGHGHLYIDASLPWQTFGRLLVAFADAGIVEPGYVMASIRRGHADLRLPGVQKPERDPAEAETPKPNFTDLLTWLRHNESHVYIPTWHLETGDSR